LRIFAFAPVSEATAVERSGSWPTSSAVPRPAARASGSKRLSRRFRLALALRGQAARRVVAVAGLGVAVAQQVDQHGPSFRRRWR
jgi:hypothetical protein